MLLFRTSNNLNLLLPSRLNIWWKIWALSKTTLEEKTISWNDAENGITYRKNWTFYDNVVTSQNHIEHDTLYSLMKGLRDERTIKRLNSILEKSEHRERGRKQNHYWKDRSAGKLTPKLMVLLFRLQLNTCCKCLSKSTKPHLKLSKS